jgi:hypothetical protein
MVYLWQGTWSVLTFDTIHQELGDQRGERSGSCLWILDAGLGMRHGTVRFSAESTLKTDSGQRFKAPVEPAECMSEH